MEPILKMELSLQGILLIILKNGVIKEILSIKDGKLNGEIVKNYENGQKLETGNFENNLKFGTWTRFSITGVTLATASYIGGKKDGAWFVYNEQGTKLFEMNYKNGEKTGIWNQWDENGTLIKTTNYSNF